jgi:hypothetical protein
MYLTIKSETLLIIVLLVNSLFGLSQTTEIIKISTVHDESVKDVVEDSFGNFYLTGNRTNPYMENLDKAVGVLWKLDNGLNIVDSLCVSNSNKAVQLLNIDLLESGNFVVSGISYDTSMRYYKHSIDLYKVSSQLEIIQNTSVFFSDSISNRSVKQDIAFDNEIILSGVMINGYGYSPLYSYIGRFSIDSLDSISLKILPSDYWYNSFTHKLINGNYFVGGSVKNGGNLPYQYIIFDSSFNYKAHYDIPEANNPFSAKWDTDTSFYMVGHWSASGGIHMIGIVNQTSIYNLDEYTYNELGNVDTINVVSTRIGLDFVMKDSIFIGGTYNFAWGQSVFANVPSWYSIVQTDSLLNVRWERFYGGDAYYIQRVTIATNDGGCLLAGERYDYQNTTELERDIYILKLNSEGLITGNAEKPKIQMHEALVFPNPGTDYLKVRVAAQYPQSIFELYNINGNKILSEKITGKWGRVETTFLPTGTYVYKIYNQKGLFETGKWVKQ